MDSVKISVVMPVFNGQEYLRKSMECALNQSLRDLELICVDDGSRDGSVQIIREYAEKDARVILLAQENQGAAAARNLALEKARGEYIAFLDCDDFYPDEKTLETLYCKAKEHGAKICGGSFSWYYRRQLITEFPEDLQPYVFRQEGMISYRDYQFDYGYHRFIYQKDMLRENGIQFPPLRRFQDVPFMVRAMVAAGEFYAIPAVTYCYRKEDDRSLPADWPSEKYRDVLRGLEMDLRLSREQGLNRLHARSWHHFCAPDYLEALKKAAQRRNYQTLQQALATLREVDPGMTEAEGRGDSDREWMEALKQGAEACFQTRDELLRRTERMTRAEKPDVTVIMPSLNVEPYIRLCIESVMRQTAENIEILCIDAGSSDGTKEILQEYAEHDARISILESDRKSYGYQVNMGIRAARGRYIAIVETDDYIAPDMFESLICKADEKNLEVIKGDYEIFQGDGREEEKIRRDIVSPALKGKTMTGEELAREIPDSLGSAMYIWAGLYRTDFLREKGILCHETAGASFQDNGFWFQIMMHTERMLFTGRIFYHLRRDNPNSSVMATNKTLCMKNEYDFIRGKICDLKDEKKKDLFLRLCAYYRFKNYEFTYHRISESGRKDFLQMMQNEFLQLEKNRELDLSFFPPEDHRILAEIMENPDQHYEKDIARLRWTQIPQLDFSEKREPKQINRARRLIRKAGKALVCLGEEGIGECGHRMGNFIRSRKKPQDQGAQKAPLPEIW